MEWRERRWVRSLKESFRLPPRDRPARAGRRSTCAAKTRIAPTVAAARLRLVQQTNPQGLQKLAVVAAIGAVDHGILHRPGASGAGAVAPAIGERHGSVDHPLALLTPPVDHQLVSVAQAHLVDARGRLAASAQKRKSTIAHTAHIVPFAARLNGGVGQAPGPSPRPLGSREGNRLAGW